MEAHWSQLFHLLSLMTTKTDSRKSTGAVMYTFLPYEAQTEAKKAGHYKSQGSPVGLFAFGWWIIAERNAPIIITLLLENDNNGFHMYKFMFGSLKLVFHACHLLWFFI